MTFKVKMGKYLVQNLCYPAVLGSFLFTIIQTIANAIKGVGDPGFLSNDTNLLLIKLLLALSLIAFFCCDYLYSYVTGKYKPKYFIIDIVAIVLLIFSFFGVNIDSTELASVNYVIWPFVGFLLFFFIWDLTLVLSIPKEEMDPLKKKRKKFFKKLMLRQVVSAMIMLFIRTLYQFDKLSYDALFGIFIANLIYLTIFYYKNVHEKYLIGEDNTHLD